MVKIICLTMLLYANFITFGYPQEIVAVESAQQTQGEFAIQLVKALGLDNTLPLKAAAEEYINILKKNGIEPAGGFQPNNLITKEDRIILLSKALSLQGTTMQQGNVNYYKNTAIILELSGDVKIKRSGSDQWINAETGMKLSENDYIKTGKNSFLHLKVGLAGRVKIKENTELLLKTISVEADKKLESICLYLAMGELVIDAREIAKGSKFDVVTPTATAAVRGTIYSVKVAETKTIIEEQESTQQENKS